MTLFVTWTTLFQFVEEEHHSKPRSPVKSLSDYKYEQFDVC